MLLFKPALFLVLAVQCIQQTTVLVNWFWSEAPNQCDKSPGFSPCNISCVKNKATLIPASRDHHYFTTEDINSKGNPTEALADEFMEFPEGRNEILVGLTKIQQQVQYIRENIEWSTNRIIAQNAEISTRYEQSLEKYVKMDESLHFIRLMAGPTFSEVANRLKWIHGYIDDQSEQLQRVYAILLHIFCLLGVVLVAAFLQAPLTVRAMIVVMITLNLTTIMKHGNIDGCLDFTSLTALIFLVTGMHFLLVKVKYLEVKDSYIKINRIIGPLLAVAKNKNFVFCPLRIADQVFTYCKDEVVIPIRSRAASWYQENLSINPLVDLVRPIDLGVEKLLSLSDPVTKKDRSCVTISEMRDCPNILEDSRDLKNSVKPAQKTNQDDPTKSLSVDEVSNSDLPSRRTQEDSTSDFTEHCAKISTLSKVQKYSSETLPQCHDVPTTNPITMKVLSSSKQETSKKPLGDMVSLLLTETSMNQENSRNAEHEISDSKQSDPSSIKELPRFDLELDPPKIYPDDVVMSPFTMTDMNQGKAGKADHKIVASTPIDRSLIRKFNLFDRSLFESSSPDFPSKMGPRESMDYARKFPKISEDTTKQTNPANTAHKSPSTNITEQPERTRDRQVAHLIAIPNFPVNETSRETSGRINSELSNPVTVQATMRPTSDARVAQTVSAQPATRPNVRVLQAVPAQTAPCLNASLLQDPFNPRIFNSLSQLRGHTETQIQYERSPFDNFWDCSYTPSRPSSAKCESPRFRVPSGYCGATTQKGTPCRNKPSYGGLRCWRH